MTKHLPSPAAVPPWALALAAMLSVQLGSALSVAVIAAVGPAGTAWLRLSMGALIFLALARPPLRAVRRPDVPALLGLGVTTGLVTIAFLAAIERIPLGTAVAIEFLGPLTVAAVRSHSRRALAWPAVALLGVILLTEPWHGATNPAGLGFAALAAIGWATYILLTQRIGDRFTGIGGLSLTVPIAAVTAAVVGIPQAAGHLTLGVLAATAGLAHPAPRTAVRVRAARAAPHDSHCVRDPDGPRTRHRGAPRSARAAPEALACPARRHPARRPCGRGRSTRWKTPPRAADRAGVHSELDLIG